MKFETGVRIGRPIDEVRGKRRWVDLPHGARAPEREGSERARGRRPRAAKGIHDSYDIRADAVRLPLPLHSKNGETVVELDAQIELEGAVALVGPFARRGVRRGVDANFAALKKILEARPFAG